MAYAQGRSVEAEVTLFKGDTEEAATCITQDNAFLHSVFQIVVCIHVKLLQSTVFTNVYLARVYSWARPLVY